MFLSEKLAVANKQCNDQKDEAGKIKKEMLNAKSYLNKAYIMMYAQHQDFVLLREYQPSNTNITLDVLYMFSNRKFRMVEKKGNGRIEQG